MSLRAYLVMESTDDYEQSLCIEHGAYLPAAGVLCWRGKEAATAFADRATARGAIERTEHYRLAFGTNHPEKRFCKIVPVDILPEQEAPQ